jgi:hypothetical protein
LPPERRRVVLDEDINWKLKYELHKRGRADATAVVSEGIGESKDGAVFKALAAGDYEPFVLVTWDNKMPIAHRAELDYHGTTLAVVDERWFKRNEAQYGGSEERYFRDVIHRWLHRIERLNAGERRYYSPSGSRSAT